MHSARGASVAFVPVDALDVVVVAWGDGGDDTSVRATMPVAASSSVPGPPVAREGRITVRRLLRTGDRLAPNGFATGVATDAVTVAAGVVWEFLVERGLGVDRDAPGFRSAAREHADRAEAAAQEAARNLADRERWTWGRIRVDGIDYALRVHRFPDGFAATADLGPDVVTIRGDVMPELLVLERRPVTPPRR